jgi:transketolase
MMKKNFADYKLMANAIRALSIDAIERAKSGHPGMPLGMADVITMLFAEFLKFDPLNPYWQDRDRFILSAGHGSMLLYSLLYLTGYEGITIEDIKNFRQLGAKTPGHPEHNIIPGIETTTGPLGQGLANAVGMAIAEKLLSARKKSDGHYTYAVVGDGCLMEGISQEAISLAGHLNLNKLIVLFDDNKISIDGPTDITISDDVSMRFSACNWNVIHIDGHDYNEIYNALEQSRKSNKPSLIACRTIIGYGSPNKSGTNNCHGSPLGKEECLLTKKELNWHHEPFVIPKEILNLWRSFSSSPSVVHSSVNEQVDLRELKESMIGKSISTRKASGYVLEILGKNIKNLIGGSADLSDSNVTKPSVFRAINAQDFSGNYIYYGVREHAMAAIMNGIALDGNFIPYAGTFLVFSDYLRPALRLSCLMGLQVFYIMTHDSIGLGEDGPTHQPIEHLASLRAIPNLYLFRPACSVEVVECYEIAMDIKNAPSLFSLTRQDVPNIRESVKENFCRFGAYILSQHQGELRVTIFATGSELSIALDAQNELHAINIGTRVVSVPCTKLFEQQPNAYKAELLHNNSIKIAVEAGIRQGWEQYIGTDGIFVGMEYFGLSAPAAELYKHFGISKENVIQKIIERLNN